MSFQFHPDAYHQTSLKHQQLIAEGELERQLRAAHAERLGLLVRLSYALGRWLIAVGERLTRSVTVAQV